MRGAASVVLVGCIVFAACDKPREILHDITKPPPSAAATTAAAPAPSVTVVVNVNVNPSAAPAAADAGKPKVAGGSASAAPAPKKAKQPELNGLPAGAVCIQGKEGNGGCASGSECTNGKCVCYNGWTSCSGACRDLSRDPYNCDKCGHECQYGEYCKWGHCDRGY